eukprot:scaffold12322_cov52-Cyclotella_meneghiniana.AAC.3
MATRRSSNTHNPAESSFIHSLVHLSQTRRRSANDEPCQEIQGISHNHQNNSGPPSEGGRCSRSTTPMSGIIKTHGHDGMIRSSGTERVTFCRSQSQESGNNDVSMPSHSHNAIAAHPRRSLRDSPNWPPPPPPRNSINVNSVPSTMLSSKQQRKNLTEVLQPNQAVKLPFTTGTSEALNHSRSYHSGRRRYSTLEMEELGDRDAPLPPPIPNRRRSDGGGGTFVSPHQEIKEHSNVRSHEVNYDLGDSLRCSSHIIDDACPQAAIERVSRLNHYDFAFVKRSNGSWSYAILASRFVGSTKVVNRSQWAGCVRCVTMIDAGNREEVPKTISINKDDCSMISSAAVILYMTVVTKKKLEQIAGAKIIC